MTKLMQNEQSILTECFMCLQQQTNNEQQQQRTTTTNNYKQQKQTTTLPFIPKLTSRHVF